MYKKDFDKWKELFFWNKWKIRNLRKKEVEKIEKLESDSIGQQAKSEMKRKREK